MCGIAGFHIKGTKDLTKKENQQCEDFLDTLLLEIENRGHDATGFVAVTQGSKKAMLDKQAITASEFINKRKPLPKDVRTVLGHTRWETQGSSDKEFNIHPVVYGSTFVTHNGTIRNDEQVFKDLKLERNAEVDSEAIAAALHSFGFTKVDEAMAKLRGGFACAAVNPIKNKDTVLLFKGPNWPISYYEDKKVFAWASTGIALRAAWKAVFDDELEWKDIDSFFEGDVITIQGDKVTKKTKPAFQNTQSTSRNHELSGSEMDWERWSHDERTRKPWTLQRKAKHTPNRGMVYLNSIDRTKKLREEGYGKAHTFDCREAVKADSKITDLSWHMCSACRVVVLSEDFVDHRLYGRICIDCNPDKALEIDREDVIKLEEFVDHEEYVYTETLSSVSTLTGISMPAIDYLVSRAKLDKSSGEFRSLHAKVKKVFDAEHVKAWEAYSETLKEEHEEETGVLTNPDSFWVSCAGEVHRSDDPCDNCRGLLGQKTLTVEPPKRENKVNKNQCMMQGCTKNWKVKISTKLGMMAWCHKHYENCSHYEMGEACKNGPNAFDEHGNRWCHNHFRSKKGLHDANSRLVKAAK